MQHQNPEHTIKELFNEHFRSLVFASFRIVKNYSQAEDIVQDIFVKIWQNFDRVKHISNLKPYLTTAVKNSSLNYLRDINVKGKFLKKTDFSIIDTLNQPEENTQEGFDSSKIHEAVERIPEKWREAFILSKYENLKYSEIATKMAVSEKTVEKYISKALIFLRIELNDFLTIILLLFFIRKL